MPYNPPLGSAADFTMIGGYTPPLGSAADFDFRDVLFEAVVFNELPYILMSEGVISNNSFK
jgi:hypothetical protein